MKKEELLIQHLKKYQKSEMYPFHMPGHKRANGMDVHFPDPFSVDITEIDGFDNLHHPEGILKDSMEWAASLYGSDHTWYSCKGKYLWAVVSDQCGCFPWGKDTGQPELS